MSFLTSELIKKKKHGGELSPDEISFVISQYTQGDLPDYQMSALAMAIWFKGMSNDEIAALTKAMKNSGKQLHLKHLDAPRIDKHSTGGLGDKTSILIGPIMAAAGVYVPMIAGRGLAHTGGTLDKLESLKGFRVKLSEAEFVNYLEKHHFALMGQTLDICPADRKLYALRDVTSTVDSLPLICGSIMSKKLAEDLTGLVLDVKWGSGAFMKTLPEAIALAELLKITGEKNGVRVSALVTDMNQPLGRFVGNALEIRECYEILNGQTCIYEGRDFYTATRELSLVLCGHMLALAEKVPSPIVGYMKSREMLESGAAARHFEEWLNYQGPTNIKSLSVAEQTHIVTAERSGVVTSMNAEKIGIACIELGAGRKTATDTIDHSTGIEMLCQIGQPIQQGQPLLKIYHNSNAKLESALNQLQNWIVIGDDELKELLPLVAKVIL